MSGDDLAVPAPVELLASRINAAHQAVEQAMRDAVARAVDAGNLLTEAKRLVGHGGWESWMEANCALSARTARAYMRLARELPRLPEAKRQRVADLSLREALAAVASDARSVRALPSPVIEKVLGAAPTDGLRRPLKRAVNEQRHKAAHTQAQARDPGSGPSIWIQASASPSSPHPGADPELAQAILALCRERAALGPEVVCETLNAVYCEVQDQGLAKATAAH